MAIQDDIAAIKKNLEKKYKDSTELFPDFLTIKQIDVLPHKSAIVNVVTGVGGMPRGRVVEVFGPEGVGKTTIAIEQVVAVQQADPQAVALYLDYEHAFDAAYARALGVDLSPDRFIFIQPESFEQGAEAVNQFISAGIVDISVIDSAAAMTPKAILAASMEDTHALGMQSRLMSQFLEVMTKKINRGRKPALMIINQTRMKIDLKNPRNSGESAAGGKALKFYTSIRLSLEEVAHEGDENRGKEGGKGTDQLYTRKRIRITAVKNKVAPPFVRGQIVIDFGKGINNVESIAELAESKMKIISGAGYIDYKGGSPETSIKCRGRDEFRAQLIARPALLNEIQDKVIATIKSEQAKLLGVNEIKLSGKAKEIEVDGNLPGDLTFSLSERSGITNSGDGMPSEDI